MSKISFCVLSGELFWDRSLWQPERKLLKREVHLRCEAYCNSKPLDIQSASEISVFIYWPFWHKAREPEFCLDSRICLFVTQWQFEVRKERVGTLLFLWLYHHHCIMNQNSRLTQASTFLWQCHFFIRRERCCPALFLALLSLLQEDLSETRNAVSVKCQFWSALIRIVLLLN